MCGSASCLALALATPGLHAQSALDTTPLDRPHTKPPGTKRQVGPLGLMPGDFVLNPVTQTSEVIAEILGDRIVRTTYGNIILLVSNVGDTFTDNNSGTTWRVTAVQRSLLGLVTAVDIVNTADSGDTRTGLAAVFDASTAIGVAGTAGPLGSGGTGSTGGGLGAGTHDINVFSETSFGDDGGDGADGGGVTVCVPFLGCATIGRSPSAGGAGADGGDLTVTVTTANNGDISVESNDRAGVSVISAGGDGGEGGNGYGVNIPGASGGRAGAGGDISLTAAVDITTTGSTSHGIFAQSRSGRGGAGGSGFIASGGGGGGTSGRGGAVSVNSSGSIQTSGTGSIGIFAQSLGGAAGGGGDSFGLVAGGGGGSAGGNGGNVSVTNSGLITTSGADAYGILAQSIGGSGGNAGTAGGLVGFGDSGGVGGSAGSATVTTEASSIITTTGAGAHGIFAQSVGGGGGSGGTAIGLVALGSSGSAGGNGSTVSVDNAGAISTTGLRARGIFAQSVGGGGGAGGTGGGLVSIGGSGGNASEGGTVGVSNIGLITTSGNLSSGIQAQSIGGGGGDGGTSGGAFLTIGGIGGGGGRSGPVTVTHGGVIDTGGQDSHGIFIQSIGGGGGNAGGAASLSAFAGVAIGGAGGSGGDGGLVDLNFTQRLVNGDLADASITTRDDRSYGIYAQSVGGGGGNGGFAAQLSGGYGGAVSVAIGGSGGSGGRGGLVDVDGRVNIETYGRNSLGLFAQSIGGGGGTGGFAISVALAGGPVGGSVSVGIGGSGGSGGIGGQVDVISGGRIATHGEFSTGLLAQSVGGGGGAGGFSVSASGAGAGGLAGSVAVGVGGSGGSGGVSGLVHTEFDGDILTLGDEAAGAIIQSVGGGGGNGGFNVSAAVSASGTASVAAAVGVGGSGGGGGAGGSVTASITGDVTTRGRDSDAILVQSTGGGGGNGGFSVAGSIAASAGAGTLAASVGVGGAGGDGGAAASASLILAGTARTEGDGSDAVIVQSTGGGGGNGGFGIAGGISGSATGLAGAVSVGVGGSGGGGGNAGDVSLTQNDGVPDPDNTLLAAYTQGDRARGLLVQSVGGGGGNGGFNVSGGIAASRTGAGNLMVGVGGSGGAGGNAGDANLLVHGDVVTEGDESGALLSQSVGGGGGNGAFNVSGGISASSSAAGNLLVGVGGSGGGGGSAGDASGIFYGDILTRGDRSVGFAVQSLGGGGGSGGFNITGGVSVAATGGAGTLGVGVGGFGGGGGDAGQVFAEQSGDIFTFGDGALGVLLQSVGGGGGSGAMNITGAVTLGRTGAGSVAFGLGGFGGGGGAGGEVNAVLNGNFATQGDAADGIVAQSIGGSGGVGGTNVAGSVSLSTGPSGTGAIGIGGFGGDGGSAGTVNFSLTGTVETDGAGSDGVLVQSIGGGGGAGGVNVSGGLSLSTQGSAGSLGFGLGGFGGGGGNGGSVTATVTGSVYARGLASDVTSPEFSLVFDLQALGLTADFTTPADRQRINGSHGVLVQSIGGGGGAGGVNITGQVSVSQPGSAAVSSRALAVGIGGFGGDGGDAGTATLYLGSSDPAARSQIQAIGDDRTAITVQSVGGGGGVGGLNISGGVAMAGTLTAGIGGFGGLGGLGRSVFVDLDANLFASGDNSRGLLAQSVGGGGGHGGINLSGGMSAAGGAEPALAFGLGGAGGAGNRSDDVTVRQSGSILVDGRNSVGLLAQSVAGGGGSGGFNAAAAVNLAGGAGLSNPLQGFGFGIGIGGTGGTGADAGNVDVRSHGDIIINGRFRANPAPGEDMLESVDFTGGATGLLAQSIGGGGGTGGVNVAGAIAPTGNPVVIGVGGSGGSGGDAGTVDIVRGTQTLAAGLIRTFGSNSDGLVAQSLGGGGGMAAMNFVLAATGGNASPSGSSVSAIINVGGSGAGAGDGDDVSVTHFGNIVTNGANSDGLFAQSLGGGGGSATFNIGLGLIRNSNSLNLTVGGDVGTGGTGGDVAVAHDGTIVTAGDNANGIMAMSVGGGGGSTMLDEIFNEFSDHSLDITIGRRGGTGGTSGHVAVEAAGLIDTAGDGANGIFAQSTGGGGGNSSASSVGATRAGQSNRNEYSAEVAVGLEGGVGAVGGDVDVDNDAMIITRGDRSHGIFAQSTGGGGGAGGAVANLAIDSSSAFSILTGGLGGTGAIGGDILVQNNADILTRGDGSEGIRALATGGGGGVGGLVATLGTQTGAAAGSGGPTTLDIRVGGQGGAGATGGAVTVANSATIQTLGSNGYGIRAQSVGGGGGIGGAVFNARMHRQGGNRSMDINVGGAGNTGGAGEAVDVTNTGTIYTGDKDAIGIVASSIGGGGGSGGAVLNAVAGNVGSGANAYQVALNVGGSGGTGGSGGAVTVRNRLAEDGVGDPIANTGRIITLADRAHGIMAQSIGGGGGNGGVVLTATAMNSSRDSLITSLSFGGAGGSGEVGGRVIVVNDGLIDTSGAGAHGILAQSVGGGGGNGAMVASVNAAFGARASSPVLAVGGVGGDGGDGGRVDVTNSGTIVVRGYESHGILAQSIGGGGGNASLAFGLTGEPASLLLSNAIALAVGNTGGGSGGTGGEVNVTNTGDIYALGDRSQAILAQSINGGGGDVGVNFNGLVGFETIPVIGPGSNPNVTQPTVEMAVGSVLASDMNASRVTVTNNGRIFTSGDHSTAGLVQAIGGGGGNAELIVNLSSNLNLPTSLAQEASPAFQIAALRAVNFNLSLGGVDGARNSGANVVSENIGEISAVGLNSHGSVIQAIGDGGGRLLADISAPAGTMLGQVSLTLGGEQGQAGSGGDIHYRQSGVMMSDGNLASAGIVQSVGGGGGQAGLFVTGDGAASGQLSANLGAIGASSAHAGAVDVEVSGGLATFGDNATALVVQSIGAGGGDLRLGTGLVPQIRLGGMSGAQGDGGTVAVTSSGVLYTEGAHSHGLVLQSIGGGGGAVFGTPSGAQLTLSADNRGDGGDIYLRQIGEIITRGEAARGVIVQSLGGGGGWIENRHAGSAGGIGRGGVIDLRFDGDIRGLGANSIGVFAQSAGRDGAGGVRIALDGNLVMAAAGSTGVHAMSESLAGTAGAIEINISGSLAGNGEGSTGIHAETRGGPMAGPTHIQIGGDIVLAGDDVIGIRVDSQADSLAGEITVEIEGSVSSTGNNARGLDLRSWATGGAGRGGAIDFSIDGTIWAVGLDSTGVFAQSVGRDGGGDIFGDLTGLVRGGSGTGRGLWIDGGADNVFTLSGSLSAVSNWAITATTGNDAVINTGLVIGNLDLGSGTNSFDNRAGSTFIAINTIDLRDPAPVTQTPLVLQSAPRVAASTLAAEVGAAWADVAVMDALDPAELGQGGEVVGAASTPLVNLDQAMADLDRVAAPAAPALVNLDQAMSSLNGLMSAPVAANNMIAVTDLPPIMDPAAVDAGVAMIDGGAQASQPDSIHVTKGEAPVVMDGLDPNATAMPIDGGAQASQPDSIHVTKGEAPAVMDVLDPGVTAMLIDGGAQASQPDSIHVTKGEAPVVMDVLDPGATAMLIDGGIDAAPVQHVAAAAPVIAAPAIGAATFSNSGTFLMGLSASRLPIDLLNGAEFGNLDAMGDPEFNLYYGTRVINTVALDGHFEQTAAGHMAFDIAFGPYASDRVDVTGTATVDGTGEVILTWLENADPVTLFAASGGGIDNGLDITDTLAIDYSIAADSGGIHLLIDTDFGLPSLNRNGQALGGHLDSVVLTGGSAGIGRLMAFLGNLQADELDVYQAVFTELNPESHLAALQGQFASANTLADDLFNCGSAVSGTDDQCVWSHLEQSSRDRTASFENFGVDGGSTRFSGGFQQPLGHDWSVAVAIGYEQINQTQINGGRAISDGQGFTAGLGLERQRADGHYYGFSVSGGWSWLETARSVTVFEPGLGLSEPQTGHLRLDGHVGNVFRTGSVFANPSLGLGLTALRHSGLTETGLDGLGVQVIRDTQLIASLNPVLRLGHVFHESETAQGVVSLTMGARVSSEDRVELPIRFTGANPTAAPAMIGTVLDDVGYQLGADIDIVRSDRVNVSFGYAAEFGENTEHHRTGFDVRMRF